MKRFKAFFDLEKEEAWLDKMTESGYRLEAVNPWLSIYTFSKVQDGEFCPRTRIDFRVVPKRDKDEYFEMYKSSGWEIVCSSNNNACQYFRQCSAEATDEIFSDRISAVQRNKRVGTFWLVLSVLCSIFAILQFISLIDANKNADLFFTVFFTVGGIGMAVFALVTFAFGSHLSTKNNKDFDAVSIQDDTTVAGDKTIRRIFGRIIPWMLLSVGVGFLFGSLSFLLIG